MQSYSLAHVNDAVLLRELATLVAQDRLTTARLLAHIAEVDARRLYVPAGYSSMHGYCVDELRLSEDAAYKRIQAARAARQFPELFLALAEGRLHLAGVCLLAPHLTDDNAVELIRSMEGKRKHEIEVLLARRFGRDQEVSRVRVIPTVSVPATLQLAPGQVEDSTSPDWRSANSTSLPPHNGQLAPGQVDAPQEVAERYFLQVTIAKETHDKLRYAQALLSHVLPNREIAPVLDRALDLLITQLEKRKFAASRSSRREGDLARKDARALRAAEARARAADAGWRRSAVEQTRDVLAGLRNLGYRSNEARRAAEYCETLYAATLEERLRAAISYLGGRHVTRAPAGMT